MVHATPSTGCGRHGNARGRRDALVDTPTLSLDSSKHSFSGSLSSASKSSSHSLFKPSSLSGSSKLSSHSLFGRPHAPPGQCRQDARLTCRTICRDYCNNTAVHGFRYFFERNRSPHERAFWVFAVFLSFVTAFYLISQIWIKWKNQPVIVTFSDSPKRVWDIPFPTVTICPTTKTKRDLFNYTQAQHSVLDNNATQDVLQKYEALSLVCMPEHPTSGTYDDSAVQFVREVAPTLDEVLVDCYWQNLPFKCSKYFQEVVTNEGVCFSFNSLSPRDIFADDTVQAREDESGPRVSGWDAETGYVHYDPSIKRFYPLRQAFVGPFSGLRVILRSYDRDMDYVCRGCEQGFRVYLHSPDIISGPASHQLALPLNVSMLLLARPTLMHISEGLRDYSPTRRMCFFGSDRPLRYFKRYTQESCFFECFLNLTLEKCGCNPFIAPRLENTTVCSSVSNWANCSAILYRNLLNEIENRMPFDGPTPSQWCHCLPACTSLRYEADASVFDYPWNKKKEARREAASSEGVSLSQLNVYFGSMQFISSQRREVYGRTDFIANVGGLLGLFTGFSIISLVEIGYYVSLRLWCDVKRRAEERRKRTAD